MFEIFVFISLVTILAYMTFCKDCLFMEPFWSENSYKKIYGADYNKDIPKFNMYNPCQYTTQGRIVCDPNKDNSRLLFLVPTKQMKTTVSDNRGRLYFVPKFEELYGSKFHFYYF